MPHAGRSLYLSLSTLHGNGSQNRPERLSRETRLEASLELKSSKLKANSKSLYSVKSCTPDPTRSRRGDPGWNHRERGTGTDPGQEGTDPARSERQDRPEHSDKPGPRRKRLQRCGCGPGAARSRRALSPSLPNQASPKSSSNSMAGLGPLRDGVRGPLRDGVWGRLWVRFRLRLGAGCGIVCGVVCGVGSGFDSAFSSGPALGLCVGLCVGSVPSRPLRPLRPSRPAAVAGATRARSH